VLDVIGKKMPKIELAIMNIGGSCIFLLYFFSIFLVFCCLLAMKIGLLLFIVCWHSNQVGDGVLFL
jgi:hypothetical protein